MVNAASGDPVRAEARVPVTYVAHSRAVTSNSNSVTIRSVGSAIGIGSISRPIVSPVAPVWARHIADAHCGSITVVSVIIGRDGVAIVIAVIVVRVAISIAIIGGG